MKKLICVYAIEGFTIGNSYKVIEDGVNLVKVCNDSGEVVNFDRIEGANDFKNHFQMSIRGEKL